MTIAEERATAARPGATGPSPSRPSSASTAVERTLHWVNATLFGILMLTGAALYAGPVSTLVGNREVVRTIHVY